MTSTKFHRPKYIPCLILASFFCLCTTIAHGQTQRIEQELHKLRFASDSVRAINSLTRLGTLYSTRNIDSSFYYGMKAKRMATRLHYQKGQTDADHVIAYALFKKGLYAESLELLSSALSSYQQVADTLNTVRVCLDIANVLHKDIANQDEVESLMQRAIQTGRNAKNDSIMAAVYLSYCSFTPNLPADTINQYLVKSTEIATRYNDEYMLALNQIWQAYLLNQTGRQQEALPLAKQSLSIAQRTGNVNLETSALFILIGCYYEDNQPKALEFCNQVNELTQKNGDRELQVYILGYALELTKLSGTKDEIINAHVALEEAMMADRESMKKFIGDYIKYNAIQDDNRLLSEKNARRGLWLVIISAVASIIVLAIYLTMLHRSRKAKEQVNALNNATNMQIIAMEEAKHQAVREEQQRLGQDLHDGLSASIAGIRLQLEVLGMDTDDALLKHKLATLQKEVTKAYEIARNKSHEWFSATEGQETQSFEQRVKLLSDSALPDSQYQKDIHIDDGSLVGVTMDTRIALLRIIQEAITNIIKHAKAKNVGILIYEEANNLRLVISDDGKGLGEARPDNAKPTMGLQSIRRRAQYLNGKTEIQSNTKGTEITVSIPLTSA